MISRMRSIPRFKELREEVEKLKVKTIENTFRSEGVTKFTHNLGIFKKYMYGIITISDKICIVALRDMLDMKMLSDYFTRAYNYVSAAEIKNLTDMWFGSTKKMNGVRGKGSAQTKASETNSVSASRSTDTLTQFFGIIGNQKPPTEELDNRSQLSDFSLKFNPIRRISEDFFDL